MLELDWRRSGSCGDAPALLLVDFWRLIELTVLHNRKQSRLVLQHPHIGDGIAINEQHVGKIARLDLTELVTHPHDLPPKLCRSQYRFHRRETEQIDKGLDVLGIRPLWRPGKAVITADQYANAALVHLAACLDRVLKVPLIRNAQRRPGLYGPFFC